MFYMDRTTLEYPLDRWTVMERNPEISTPINWDDSICASLNVWPVYARSAQQALNYDQKYIESAPVEIEGIWYQNWIVVDLTSEELKEKTQQQWNIIIQTQQVISSTNVVILPNGNVTVAPTIVYDYDLPNENNIVINGGNVYVDNEPILTETVIVNGEAADINIDQAIVGSNISVEYDNAMVMHISTADDIQPESNVIVVAGGNVDVVMPYPQEIQIPYIDPEVPNSQYEDYMIQVLSVTSQPNPFEIVWPMSPFGQASTVDEQ